MARLPVYHQQGRSQTDGNRRPQRAARTRKAPLPASPEAIPQALKSVARWVCWDYATDGSEKLRKLPIAAGGDHGCNYNDPSQWRTFDAAWHEAESRGGFGLGFVFSEADDIVGIDLDGCYDDDGRLADWGRQACREFAGCYCEQTPSGKGLHFIGRADAVAGRSRVDLGGGHLGVERYSRNRWFTVTGAPVCDGDICDIRDGMSWLAKTYFATTTTTASTSTTVAPHDDDPALDAELGRVCLTRIKPSRSHATEDWLAVGYACKGTSEGLRDDWLRWSAQWPDFDRAECLDRWQRFAPNSGIGTLVHLAKQDSGASAADLRKEAAGRLGRVAGEAQEARSPQAPTFLDAIAQWDQHAADPVVPTGLAPFDDATQGGLPRGALTGLVAPPGCGKSALALQLVLGALRRDRELRAVYGLGEMMLRDVAQRYAAVGAAVYGLPVVTMLEARNRHPRARDVLVRLGNDMGDRMSFVESPLSVSAMRAEVEMSGAKLLVVDFLQLVRGVGASQVEQIDIVIAELQNLAVSLDVAVIVISSMSKAAGQQTAAHQWGRGSASIGYALALLYVAEVDEHPQPDGTINIHWACRKARSIERQDIDLVFDGAVQTFMPSIRPVEAFASHAPAESEW